jgi:guanylate kinase
VNWITYSISYTTRPPRPGEIDGVDYFFVTPDVFRKMEEAGNFLETAEVYGNYYGTARAPILEAFSMGKDVLVDIDIQGARSMRKSGLPSLSVYILPPSYDVLKERLSARAQDSPETIRKRLERAKNEINSYNEYDYLLINREFDRAAQDLLAIFRAEHYRKSGLQDFMEH